MSRTLTILGSTGTIGRKTAAIAKFLGYEVAAITAGTSVEKTAAQARELGVKYAVLHDEAAARALKTELADTDIKVLSGEGGMIEAATLPEVDCVCNSVSGAIGLRPTLAAIDEKKRIALANKETLVCAGDIVMKRVKESGAELIPVDSEHSAIFQCLGGRNPGELEKILLTASGGPFRGRAWGELESIRPEDAIKHPNWAMGAKISVDSATMMNKGLEVIEAMHLFGVTPDMIQIVVHPQSMIHSMIQLVDGTVLAQLAVADMGLPIQLALTYPERCPSFFGKLDFASMADFTFEVPDYEKFPCLALAHDCAVRGGTAPCVMSAADEEAVHLFLKGRIKYTDIYDASLGAVEAVPWSPADDLDTVLAADRAAREHVLSNWGK